MGAAIEAGPPDACEPRHHRSSAAGDFERRILPAAWGAFVSKGAAVQFEVPDRTPRGGPAHVLASQYAPGATATNTSKAMTATGTSFRTMDEREL
jgi:hypothetical protein